VKIPIACSLEAEQAENRIDEWRTFLAHSVTGAARDEESLRLRLTSSDQALLDAVDLAAREKACCGFFVFRIEVDADTRTLEVRVPSDAAAVLDDFARLLPAEIRP
jgi:MerR family transcriptional regulator, copper efflux regulator